MSGMTRVEIIDELVAAEERLEAAELRRTAAPASLLLFFVLAFVLLRDRLVLFPVDLATTVWYALFFGGISLAIVGNEIWARRVIRRSHTDLEVLQARLELASPKGPESPGTVPEGGHSDSAP